MLLLPSQWEKMVCSYHPLVAATLNCFISETAVHSIVSLPAFLKNIFVVTLF